MSAEVLQAAAFRAYPTAEQEVILRQWTGAARYVWNQFTAHNRDLYQSSKQFDFFAALTRLLPAWKREFDRTWLADPPAISLVDVARRYDTALRKALSDRKALKQGKRLGRKAAGFPTFHKKREGWGSLYLTGQGLRLDRHAVTAVDKKNGRGSVIVSKLGALKIKGGRWPSGHIHAARLRQIGGKWFFSVQFTAPVPVGRTPMPEPARDMLGIDLGLDRLIAESDGTKHEAPKHLRKAEKKLRRAQRRFSRVEEKRRRTKAARSNAHKRRQAQIVRLHRQVANRRNHHLHVLSRGLIAKARVIGTETLGIAAMARTRKAKSVLDAAWGELLRQIGYKAVWFGRRTEAIGRFDRSTGCCPDCGLIGPRLAEGIREWTCAKCGVVHDRDVAAARWIERCIRETLGRGTPEATRGERRPLRRGLGLRRKSTRGTANVGLDATGVESQ